MQSPSFEKEMECLLEMMKKKTVVPTGYSEAYLSGRDLVPLLPQTPQPHSSSKENVVPDPFDLSFKPKSKPKPKALSKPKETTKEPEAVVPQQPLVDWSDYINRDVKSMDNGLPLNPLSDAYIINMAPKAINMFMTQKFMSPLKNIRDSILKSGIENVRSIEQDAINSEELRLSIRFAVGKKIKSKIAKIDNVPEELKRDIEIVFN